MKYELVSLSVHVKGKTFKKSDKKQLDDAKLGKELCLSLYRQGFIKPVGSKAETVTETVAQYFAENQKELDEKAEKELQDRQKSDEDKAKALEDAQRIAEELKTEKQKAEEEAATDGSRLFKLEDGRFVSIKNHGRTVIAAIAADAAGAAELRESAENCK